MPQEARQAIGIGSSERPKWYHIQSHLPKSTSLRLGGKGLGRAEIRPEEFRFCLPNFMFSYRAIFPITLQNTNLRLEIRSRNGLKLSTRSIAVPLAPPRIASTAPFSAIAGSATHSKHHCYPATEHCATRDGPSGATCSLRKSAENVYDAARKVQPGDGNGRGRTRPFDGQKGGDGFAG